MFVHIEGLDQTHNKEDKLEPYEENYGKLQQRCEGWLDGDMDEKLENFSLEET